QVANYVGKKLNRFAETSSSDSDRAEKIRTFAENFVTAAFRRPLSPDEKLQYVTARFDGAPDPDTAIKRVVLFALKSPQFLYVELPSVQPADAFALAARLSYGLWD